MKVKSKTAEVGLCLAMARVSQRAGHTVYNKFNIAKTLYF